MNALIVFISFIAVGGGIGGYTGALIGLGIWIFLASFVLFGRMFIDKY